MRDSVLGVFIGPQSSACFSLHFQYLLQLKQDPGLRLAVTFRPPQGFNNGEFIAGWFVRLLPYFCIAASTTSHLSCHSRHSAYAARESCVEMHRILSSLLARPPQVLCWSEEKPGQQPNCNIWAAESFKLLVVTTHTIIHSIFCFVRIKHVARLYIAAFNHSACFWGAFFDSYFHISSN